MWRRSRRALQKPRRSSPSVRPRSSPSPLRPRPPSTSANYQVFVPTGGHTTSVAMLARFLRDDPELERLARIAIRTEESNDPDALHAEVAHHIEGLATNMSSRPLLRDYEIDVAGASGAPDSRRITLDDLLVSVKSGRVQLRSRTHGKRVVPHLSSAHAYSYPGLAVYRFLAYLQTQGLQCNGAWSWGALSDAPFLPRVTHGKVVLSLATWRLPASRIASLGRTPSRREIPGRPGAPGPAEVSSLRLFGRER